MLPEINWRKLLEKYRWQIIFFLIGFSFVGLGILSSKDIFYQKPKIEVLESSTVSDSDRNEVVVEIVGAVENPGIYRFSPDARIEDLLIAADGLAADADRNWVKKFLNRAAKLTDGQKIYIPTTDKQSEVLSASYGREDQTISFDFLDQGSDLVNINTASPKELEALWGISPVIAQNIIEHRPYSSVEELLQKKILETNVFEENKTVLTVY